MKGFEEKIIEMYKERKSPVSLAELTRRQAKFEVWTSFQFLFGFIMLPFFASMIFFVFFLNKGHTLGIFLFGALSVSLCFYFMFLYRRLMSLFKRLK